MDLKYGSGPAASLYHYAHGSSVYVAYATGVTALPAYSATTLGPILYNGNTGNPPRKAVIIGITVGLTTASAAAVSVGLAGGVSVAPINTTAITLASSTNEFGKLPTMSVYGAGTVSAAPLMYWPLVNLDTAALTANSLENMWIPLDGGIVVRQGSYIALAASATATTSVLEFGIVWAELPT
jgi:hypothetical protein